MREEEKGGGEEVNTKEEKVEGGDKEGEGRRGTDSSILIPEWLFEQPNIPQDDATRGASGSSSSSSEDKMESPRCRCCPSWHPWFFIGLGWLPILVGIFLSLSIVIPYCIAVGLKHVSPGFPYIR
nr:uncharacterized protein LOC129268634 [Lytechinus pictus]